MSDNSTALNAAVQSDVTAPSGTAVADAATSVISKPAPLVDQLWENGSQKNRQKISCLRCDSYILQANSCVFARIEPPVEVPSMRKKKELADAAGTDPAQVIQTEPEADFWRVKDMLTFENVGFTNTVSDKKYLICADCEVGPIGFQALDKPDDLYVCLNRVKYSN